MFYVLHVSPTAARSSVLRLEGHRTLADARALIAHQEAGGFPASDYVIATYDRDANCFPGVERLDVRWQPDCGWYTAEAWGAFCKRLRYDPDGEARPPLPMGAEDALAAYAAKHGRTWKATLREAWMGRAPHDDTGVLRELRNTHGPEWLKSFRLPKAGA